MYILIVLATMTNLGTYPTKTRCETAVRQIYEQRLDPYHLTNSVTLKKIVDSQMKYSAPTEYRCQQV